MTKGEGEEPEGGEVEEAKRKRECPLCGPQEKGKSLPSSVIMFKIKFFVVSLNFKFWNLKYLF